MESPKKSYYKNRRNRKTVDNLQERFSKVYIRMEENDDAFRVNEQEITPKSKVVMPGKIYTFQYDPKSKDVLSFYDTRPIILLQNVWKPETENILISGINLTFLPPMVRVSLLESYYQSFKRQIERDESDLWKNELRYVKSVIEFFTNWLKTKQLFEGSDGVHLDFAFRNYITKRMNNLKIVSYNDWEIIPHLRSEFLVGNTLGTIYNKYYKERRRYINKN